MSSEVCQLLRKEIGDCSVLALFKGIDYFGKKKNETLSDKFFMGDCVLAADMGILCIIERDGSLYQERPMFQKSKSRYTEEYSQRCSERHCI